LPTYTDATVTPGRTLLKAAHILDLRSAVAPLEAVSPSGSAADQLRSPLGAAPPAERLPVDPLLPSVVVLRGGGDPLPAPAPAPLSPAPVIETAPSTSRPAIPAAPSGIDAVTTASPAGSGMVAVSDPTEATPVRVAGVMASTLGRLVGGVGATTLEMVRNGVVVIRADARYGPIAVGDLLVTSPTPGYVMRAGIVSETDPVTPWSGVLVGEALQPLGEGQGDILVLLRLE
jgi:hypothetical protein